MPCSTCRRWTAVERGLERLGVEFVTGKDSRVRELALSGAELHSRAYTPEHVRAAIASQDERNASPARSPGALDCARTSRSHSGAPAKRWLPRTDNGALIGSRAEMGEVRRHQQGAAE